MALRKSSWSKRDEHGVTDLGIVERLVQCVEAEDVLVAESDCWSTSLMFLSFASSGSRSWPRRLDHVDLAVLQRGDLGLRVGHRDPFDAVDLDDLAAGQARRRLGARLVLGVLDVDRSSRPASTRRP